MAKVTRDPVSGALQLNLYATGAKTYGENGSHTATAGPVTKAGYAERDRRRKARKNALQRRLALSSAYDALGGA